MIGVATEGIFCRSLNWIILPYRVAVKCSFLTVYGRGTTSKRLYQTNPLSPSWSNAPDENDMYKHHTACRRSNSLEVVNVMASLIIRTK